jgi:predicted NUDIX family phosphoesterase
MNENVMVVPRAELAQYLDGRDFGMITSDLDSLLRVIERKHQFIARAHAETAPEFKQIIPYVIIQHGDEFFLLKRTSKQTEARLHHKLSLGIGGHINPDTPTLLGGLEKELEEEVSVPRGYTLTFAGILNDDTTDVGRVHLGAVYLLTSPSRAVSVRETDKMTGAWTPRADLAASRDAMETWSQIVYDELLS